MKRYSNIAFFSLLISLILTSAGHSEIITDGTVGVKNSLQGPNFIINESLGARSGDNLFHSFQQFNINNSESATFTGDSAIKNVINRVTGGNSSTINGLLKSEIGSQGFYFINPSGIVFGSQALVDVPASFYISTANKLVFSDGSTFDAANPDNSSLSISSPEAFGFGSGNNGNITIDGSYIKLTDQKILSISANNIILADSSLTVDEGNIQLIAHGLTADNISIANPGSQNHRGDLQVVNSSLAVQGNGSGSILIEGNDMTASNTQLKLNNNGDKPASGSGLQITLNNLELDSTRITAKTLAAGNGAKINIQVSNQLTLKNKTGIITQNSDSSSGLNSDININAGHLLVTNNSEISSSTLTDKAAGNINITSTSTTLDGFSENSIPSVGAIIKSESLSRATGGEKLIITQATGNAGNITITTETLNLFRTGAISTSTYASGNGGVISLLVNSLNIDSQGYIGKVFTQASREQIPQPTGIFSNSSIYKATGIKDGDSDQLLFIHPVTDEAIYKPNLVDISIPAQGDGGSIFISANQSVSLIDGGKISASTFTKGNAGLIDITADKIIIDHNNQQTQTNTSLVNTGIFSISNPGATGNAGNINLTSHDIQILNNARIFTGTLSSGNAGIISIITGNLLADNNAYISSDTSSTGNAGHINLEIQDLQMKNNSAIFTNTGGEGNAGTISLNANQISISTYAEISSNSTNSGNAGIIQITSNSTSMDNFGRISTSSSKQGNAGSIKLKTNSLRMQQTAAIDSTAESTGNAGNITIDATDIVMKNSLITVKGTDNMTPFAQQTPSINITTHNLKMADLSNISAQTSGSANAADITIHAINDIAVTELSRINSDAIQADGGSITLSGNRLLLTDGLVTTSVGREKDPDTVIFGDAGDIFINNKKLFLITGFIQANTQGREGHGGDITINSNPVVSVYQLEVGGGEPKPFIQNSRLNIIQAASPQGSPGKIDISSPIVDLSSESTVIKTKFQGLQKIASNPCQLAANSNYKPSSLIISTSETIPFKSKNYIIPATSKIRQEPLIGKNQWQHQKTMPAFSQLSSLCSQHNQS